MARVDWRNVNLCANYGRGCFAKLRKSASATQKRRLAEEFPGKPCNGELKLRLEKFAVVEEALEFDSGGFRSIGCVTDVFHHIGAEVSTDGAGGSFF